VAFLIVAGITGDGEFTDPEEAKEGQTAGCPYLMSRSLMDCMICKVIGRQILGGSEVA